MEQRRDPRPTSGRTLAFGGAGFLALTAGVFWYQFARLERSAATPQWDDIRWPYLALLIVCLPLETLACGLRIWVLARVLEPGVKLWTCIRAEWAQVAVSTLTPTQSAGGAGQIYIMNRQGIRIGTAVTIMLLSCLGTLVALFSIGLYALLVAGTEGAGPAVRTAMWTVTGIGAVMVLAALWPGLVRVTLGGSSRTLWRLLGRPGALYDWRRPGDEPNGPPADRMGRYAGKVVELVYTYRRDAGRFLREGKTAFVGVCLLSLAFILARAVISFLIVRMLGIDAVTLRHILEVQIVVLLIEFIAPTPGGAGIVEGASVAVMADIVPPGCAPHYTLLWRFATLYLSALAGFLCLARALFQDARRVARPRGAGRVVRATCTTDPATLSR